MNTVHSANELRAKIWRGKISFSFRKVLQKLNFTRMGWVLVCVSLLLWLCPLCRLGEIWDIFRVYIPERYSIPYCHAAPGP